MFLRFIFCITVLFWENYAILQIKDSFKKKDLVFVENLKQDLRRNNDDYMEFMRRGGHISVQTFITSNVFRNTKHDSNKMFPSVIPKISNKLRVSTNGSTSPAYNVSRKNPKEDVRNKIVDQIRRRVNDAFESKKWIGDKDIDDDSPQRRVAEGLNRFMEIKNTGITPMNNIPTIKTLKGRNKMIHINTKNLKLVSSKNNALLPLPTLQSSMSNIQINGMKQQLSQAKKSKMEKFKLFLQKNKGLLKEFISSKMASQIPLVPVTQKIELRQKQNKSISERELRKAMQDVLKGLRGKQSEEELPDPQMLDMAPAKGGRIHLKRLRGRLCHRHVLIPEGPKYDSRGHPYLPPHEPVLGHPYNATKDPPVLLPRCCNCCRKSALGCQ